MLRLPFGCHASWLAMMPATWSTPRWITARQFSRASMKTFTIIINWAVGGAIFGDDLSMAGARVIDWQSVTYYAGGAGCALPGRMRHGCCWYPIGAHQRGCW